jgi:hypothetical protein
MYDEYLTRSLNSIMVARQTLYSYKDLNFKEMKNTASCYVQLSIEYILKYCIYNDSRYNKGSSDIEQLKTRDLDLLISEYCIPYGISVPSKIKKKAKTYTEWEYNDRHDIKYLVRTDSILTALADIEAWLIEIKPSYKAKLNKMKEMKESLHLMY